MSNFEWPWEYSFPPFFTIQKHDKTREVQLTAWADLILKYQKFKNQAIININEESDLFFNRTINRKLPLVGKLLVLEELQKTAHASPIDKNKLLWEIYWFTLDEWGNKIYNWASEHGMSNTVCTLFEITNGENAVEQDFHELDENVLVKALKILESKHKCELMFFDENKGVKFF